MWPYRVFYLLMQWALYNLTDLAELWIVFSPEDPKNIHFSGRFFFVIGLRDFHTLHADWYSNALSLHSFLFWGTLMKKFYVFLPLQKPALVAQNSKTFRHLSSSFSQTYVLKRAPRHLRAHFRCVLLSKIVILYHLLLDVWKKLFHIYFQFFNCYQVILNHNTQSWQGTQVYTD